MGRIEELFAAVWERPDDVELRLVLGDALLEVGDPRGELIQMQRHPHADHDFRAMRLIQQHGLTWCGSLRGAVVPLSYELGFLASCVAIDPDAGGRVEWATVHTIDLGIEQVELVFDPAMRSLRRVTGVQDKHLKQLLRAKRSPREIEARLSWDRLPGLLPRLAGLADLHAFALPGLRLSRDEAGRLGALEIHDHVKVESLLDRMPRDSITQLIVHDTPPDRRAALERHAQGAQDRLASIRHVD